MGRYGKILKNPLLLVESLGHRGFFDWMDDEKYLRIIYKARLHKKLNLDNPKTFNEKLQWLKLHDRNPLYSQLVDKYEVRKYIAEKIGEEYLIPLLGVWEKFDEIDFEKLPNQFVLKCTHDSGGLVICRDKSKLDIRSARKKINKCLKRNYYWATREWPYKNVKPRIIAEKYMEDESGKGLIDYKYFCLSGKPMFLYISEGLENHLTAEISFFDLNWERLPFKRNDFIAIERVPHRPQYYEKMEKLASTCACMTGTSFVRVDLYSIDGKIYFSEFTFSPCSGMIPFEPEEWDYTLGNWIDLKG